MKTNKLSVLISIFNFTLMLLLFTGSSTGDNAVSIGNNCRLVEDGSFLKLTYNGTTRFVINKTNGNITAGAADGTGENTIYSNILSANSVTASLNTIPYLELVSHSGLTMAKNRGYIYMNNRKLILAYMDNTGNTFYYWIDLAQGSDINTWTYSSTEP